MDSSIDLYDDLLLIERFFFFLFIYKYTNSKQYNRLICTFYITRTPGIFKPNDMQDAVAKQLDVKKLVGRRKKYIDVLMRRVFKLLNDFNRSS